MAEWMAWTAARSVCALASVGACLSCAEWLLPTHQLAPHGLYANRGLLQFDEAQSRRLVTWRSSGVRVVLALRLTSAALFLACFACGAGGVLASSAVLGTALLGMVLRLDEPVGLYLGMDGAEGMLTTCLLSLGIAFAIGTPLALLLGVAFVALQAQLEYASAGWTKLYSLRGWASGNHLLRVVASSNYGHPWCAERARRYPLTTGALSLGVISFEIAMPGALLLPSPYAELLLGCALTFHVGSALVMGFNSFVWAFAATFPAMLCCRDLLARALTSVHS